MVKQAYLDRNVLAAVKPGLDRALAGIRMNLERYLDAPLVNAQALSNARSELQLVLAAFRSSGMAGLAAFGVELDAVLRDLQQDSQRISILHRDVLRRALFGMTHFLNGLAGGADNVALRLFPQYQEMQQLRGMEMSFELDLFFPDLAASLPAQLLGVPQQDNAAVRLKALRSQYQLGLMHCLRQENVASALRSMQQALQGVMACMPQDAGRTFWWIATGMLECLALDGLPADPNLRRLLGRIDQHIRAVTEGGHGDSQAVVNEMLYLIGRSRCSSELPEAIRDTYALNYYLPEPAHLSAAEVERLLAVMRDQLGGAEENWLRYVQGDPAAAEKYFEAVEQLAAQAENLDRNTLQFVTQQIHAAAQFAGTPEQARSIAVEMAMLLLLLERGIEHYSSLGSRFQYQGQLLFERVQAALHKQPEDEASRAELVGQFCQMELGDVRMAVANEMLANLQRSSQSLHAFFSDPSRRDELTGTMRLLSQVPGAMYATELDQARRLLGLIQDNLRRCTQGSDTFSSEQAAGLTGAVNALESYLEQLAHGQDGDEVPVQAALTELNRLLPAAPALPAEAQPEKVVSGPASGEIEELLEVFLEEAHEVLQIMRDNLQLCELHPASREPLVIIRRGFHTLKGSGRMVGLSDLGEVAWNVERALNKWLHDDKPPAPGLLHFINTAAQSFAAWVDVLDNQGTVQIEADELSAAAQLIENGNDPEVPAALEQQAVMIGETSVPAELFEIASAEAQQNVAILQQQLDELYSAATARVQYDFMRAAHTLAGVNRSMGLVAVAELAYALEDWLQARVEKAAVLDAAQLEMLQQVIDALAVMTQSVCSKQMPRPRADLAERLFSQQRIEADVAVSVTPSAVVEAQPAQPAPAAKQQVRDDIDEQLLPVFLEEADEICPRIGSELRAWREQPDQVRHPDALKRLLHTLKGSARMAGTMRIGEIAHEMEERVLAAARLREQAGYWDSLEGDSDRIGSLLEELRSASVKPEVSGRRAERRTTEAEHGLSGGVLRVRAEVVDRLVNQAGEVSVARSRIEAEMRAFKEGLLELTSSVVRLRKQLREVEIQAESQMQARVSMTKDSAEQFDPLEFDRFTRLQELTRFMNESVHDVQTVQQLLLKNFDETAAALQVQARLNRELQKNLMSVRMVPFASINERLYRIVRQTGKELNKRANLELLGGNVELDRSVLERMTAPFEHLLRNAMVHGLESSALRVQQGKNPIGEIQLRVRQESNEVVFEFSDDGAGLNFPALRDRAIAKGLLQADAPVSDQQLAQMIFTSGISTAAEVTEVAGRGIGMDVVRSEVAALGGRADVSSTPGQGTRFIIHLPLTLAITHALMVRAGERNYAIPASMIEQVRQVKASELAQLYRDRHISWQGKTYPLHYLASLLGEVEHAPENLPHNPLLLLRSGEQHIAVHLDEILGHQEVVVKNIGTQLARLPGISGATVTGDGTVVLILNPVQLAQRIGAGQVGIESAAPLRSEPLVMVVDDSLTVRKVTTRLLNRAGYQVVTAKDGMDALEQLGDIQPAVMLLDIEMPRMDGFELAKQLRRDAKTLSLPIIMITSRTADKHRDYAMQLGVNAYFGKPYPEQALLEKIAELIAASAPH